MKIQEYANRTLITDMSDDCRWALHQFRYNVRVPAQNPTRKYQFDYETKNLYIQTMDGTIILSRGAFHVLKEMLDNQDGFIPFTGIPAGKLTLSFPEAQLHPYQLQTIDKLTDCCLLKAPTGSGKTIMALAYMARKNVSTLILCKQKVLLDQWRQAVSAWLDIPLNDVGQLGDGKRDQKSVTVGITNTTQLMVEDGTLNQYDLIIADECHGVNPGTEYEAILRRTYPCYLLGLTATPDHNDIRITRHMFGEIIEAPSIQWLTEDEKLMPYIVYVHRYQREPYDEDGNYTANLSHLSKDEERLALVIREIKREVDWNTDFRGVKLVLVERKIHIKAIKQALSDVGILSEVVQGSITQSERERIYAAMKAADGEVRVLIGQTSIATQGLDIPQIDTVILATPFSRKGNLTQAIGRALRTAPGKALPSRIIDIHDMFAPFSNGAYKRLSHYRQQQGVKLIIDGKLEVKQTRPKRRQLRTYS